MSRHYISRFLLLLNFLDRNYQHPHSSAHDHHRRHYSSSDLNYLQSPRSNSSHNSYYFRASSQPIKDYSNNSVQSPLALHSTNNIQASKASLNKSSSIPANSYNNRSMNSNSKMANDHHKHNPSNPSTSSARNSKPVNSNHLKKKIISPEEVIQLFSVPQHGSQPQHSHLTGFLGHNNSHSAGRQRTSSGSAINNDNQRGRKSPSSASSPPTMSHQVSLIVSVHFII